MLYSLIMHLQLLKTIIKGICECAEPQKIKCKKGEDVVQPGNHLIQYKSRHEDTTTTKTQRRVKGKEHVYNSKAEGNSTYLINSANKANGAVQELCAIMDIYQALRRKAPKGQDHVGDAIKAKGLEKNLAVLEGDLMEKSREKLCNEYIAKAEEEEGYDKRDGLYIDKETKMQCDEPAAVVYFLCYTISKVHEQQDCCSNCNYPQEQERFIVIQAVTYFRGIYFYSLGVALSSRKCFFYSKSIPPEPSKKLQKIQDDDSFQFGKVLDDFGRTDGRLQIQMLNKNDRQHAELVNLELPAKLAALFRDPLLEAVEQQKSHEWMIDTSRTRRDGLTPEAAGTSPLHQPASDGQETSEEAASSQEEWLPQSNEDSPSGKGSLYHGSSALPVDSSGGGAVHEGTDVKPFFDSQTQNDLETDEVSRPSAEDTLDSEADAPREYPSQSQQKSVTTASSHNSTEISHEFGSRAARQNLPETPERDQAEALSQSFQQTMQESASEMESTNSLEILAMPEAEASQHVGLRGNESIASSDSLSEVTVGTASPQYVRARTPVAVSVEASLDSVLYDGCMLRTPPPSPTHWQQGSSPFADTSNLAVVAHCQTEDLSTLSNDTRLNGHCEQCSFHTSPGTPAGTCHEAFPVQISDAQSVSPRATHSHSQPHQPVAECSNPMPADSQRVHYPQGEAEHAAVTSQVSTPSTATQCDRTRDQGYQTNSAPVLRLPPIIVHSASALPPWATQTARIDLSQAANRQFAPLLRRRGTYDDHWPNHSGIDPANMALAGFYRIGPGRRVRCFFCGLQLDHLRSTDNIWDEHVRHRHTCVYLRAIMGEDFVQQTLLSLDKLQK